MDNNYYHSQYLQRAVFLGVKPQVKLVFKARGVMRIQYANGRRTTRWRDTDSYVIISFVDSDVQTFIIMTLYLTALSYPTFPTRNTHREGGHTYFYRNSATVGFTKHVQVFIDLCAKEA